MRLFALLVLCVFLTQPSIAQKNKYSDWTSDTTFGHTGKFIITKTRIKKIKNTSVNKIQNIAYYYNECGDLVQKHVTIFKGSVVPRPIKWKYKKYKSGCQMDFEEIHQNNLLSSNKLVQTHISDTLFIESSYQDSLVLIIKSDYGQELYSFDISTGNKTIPLGVNFFPWKGVFVAEYYLGTELVARNEFITRREESK